MDSTSGREATPLPWALVVTTPGFLKSCAADSRVPEPGTRAALVRRLRDYGRAGEREGTDVGEREAVEVGEAVVEVEEKDPGG